MKKYVHIGYARCGSSWLQKHLFPEHKQLLHLGRDWNDGIIDDSIRIALWSSFIQQPEFLYDHEETKKSFSKYFQQAASTPGIKACGISHELLTYTITGRVDLTERARRIARIFDDDTDIIMIIRNQCSSVRSTYTGLVQEHGITRTWEEFLFYFFFDRDRSSFCSLYYDKVFDLYENLFGRGRVHVIPFEILKANPKRFADMVCDALEIERMEAINPSPHNKSPSPEVLQIMFNLNKQLRFYMGNDIFERPHGYTVAPMYGKLFSIDVPKEIHDAYAKYRLVFNVNDKTVEQANSKGVIVPPMQTEMPKRYQELIQESFHAGNAELQKMTGLDLASFGYPV